MFVNVQIPIKWKYSVESNIIPRLWVFEEVRSYFETQIIQHRCFPVNIAKCLCTAFYIKHFVPIHYTFQNFYVMIEFFQFFGYKIDVFHIPCVLFSFITLVLES